MFRLLETIKIKDRRIWNVRYHNERMNRSREELLGLTNKIDLEYIIEIPKKISNDIYKCRIIYHSEIESIEFQRYTPKAITSLKLVECNDIHYSHKFADRTAFEKLLNKKVDCDDILIIKDGFITDTSFSNVVLFDGKDWITPSTPLFKGTKRAQLLDEGKIREGRITVAGLQKFHYLKLINAMLELEDSAVIDIGRILI